MNKKNFESRVKRVVGNRLKTFLNYPPRKFGNSASQIEPVTDKPKQKKIIPKKVKKTVKGRILNLFRKKGVKDFVGDIQFVVYYGTLIYLFVFSILSFGSKNPIVILGYGSALYLFYDMLKYIVETLKRK